MMKLAKNLLVFFSKNFYFGFCAVTAGNHPKLIMIKDFIQFMDILSLAPKTVLGWDLKTKRLAVHQEHAMQISLVKIDFK